jgi:glycosyltransferase involved in cell wall biosynthesis/SAM-dependent methyltransferase
MVSMRPSSPFKIQHDFAKAACLYMAQPGTKARSGMKKAFEAAHVGKWGDAAGQFATAAQMEKPQDAFYAYFHSGVCHLLCDQIIQAAAAFQNAAVIQPDDFSLHLYTGITNYLLGLFGRANIHWWRAYQTDANQTIKEIVRHYLSAEHHPERFALYPLCLGTGIDVGCGSYKIHPQAIGVDLVPGGQLGKTGCVAGCVSQADVAASGDELPLHSVSLDYVVSRHNLEHYNDPILAVSEWGRVLKPGGVLGIIVPDERFCDTIRLDPTHKHVFTPSSLQRLFDLLTGFDFLYLEKLLFRWSFICIAQKRPVREGQRFNYLKAVTDFEIIQVKAQALRYSRKGMAAMADQCEHYARRLAREAEIDTAHISSADRIPSLQSCRTQADACGAEEVRKKVDKRVGPELRSSPEMLHLGLVQGDGYGWGICSRYLIKELSKARPVAMLSPDDGSSENPSLAGILFQALKNVDLEPMFPNAGAVRNFGYTFFENELTEQSRQNARGFEKVLGGSTWCLERMREKGIGNCDTLIQGIDPEIFYPIEGSPESDRFVVFSGGKFELRKGQDLVLRAIKIMQDRHKDVWLVNCWYNLWPASTHSMGYSSHIRFEHRGNECWTDTMLRTYEANGLDSNRIVTCELMPQHLQRDLYARTHVGLFPNRCEGGTNLVLMEYMACGKPVIASNGSGHRDIVNEHNALLLNQLAPFNVLDAKNALIARWQEPSLDEIVARLEYAYHHRQVVQQIGRQAGMDLKKFTWGHTAQRLLEIIEG